MPVANDCDCHGDGQRRTKRGVLAREVEQRTVSRRIQEAAREEISRYYQDAKAKDTASNNEMHDDFKRKGREFKERQAEAQMLETLYQNERNKTLTAIRAEEEERLAVVLAKRQQEKDRTDREIQKLRAESDEIRVLAEKIRTARANKEREEQKVEKAVLREQQREYEDNLHTYVAETEAAAEARRVAEEQRRREQAVAARLVLEEQMAERADMQRLAEAEAVREREMVDEVVRRIMEEDVAEVTLKRNKQEETKAFIAHFLAEQEDARRRRAEEEAAQERQINQHWEMVRAREADEAAKAALRKEVADRTYEKIKKELEEEMHRREEEEALIALLRREELEEKYQAEEAARVRKAAAMRADLIAANEYQMRLKAEREAAMKREEEDFRAAMMAKFAEDDRIEQMNAQKRRMRLAEHAREVQRLIDEKRRMFEEQKAAQEAAEAAVRAEEERRRGIIEQERRKLLAEAADLKDFFPKGVLRDQADMEYLNSVLAGMQVSKR